MEVPNYVLKSVENMRVPKDEKKTSLKKLILIIIGILFVGSFVFKTNLFGELSWITRIILLTAFLGTLFSGGSKLVGYPIELHFYGDRIIIYRNYVYYGKNKSRKEIYVFQYNDIQQCTLNKLSNRLMFKGKVYVEWFNYNKNGMVPEIPDVSKKELGLCYFYINSDSSVNFVNEIEAHSPIKITIE